ncbi:MAG: hypothetical protein A2X81_14515 [Desulfobacterales bacterium GWB2_56_26]|nr:MAG: hypothetical protein A2X81_14515 [Desulfobacterales bacterium GWB2_56_26]
MSVIPLFILMGAFAFEAGMSEDLYRGRAYHFRQSPGRWPWPIFREVIPFLVAEVLELVLLVSIPQLSLFLPSLM